MTDLRQRFEQWIDEAAHPEFCTLKLHRLANEIETSTLLNDHGKQLLMDRIRLKFEQRNALSFVQTECGWKREAA